MNLIIFNNAVSFSLFGDPQHHAFFCSEFHGPVPLPQLERPQVLLQQVTVSFAIYDRIQERVVGKETWRAVQFLWQVVYIYQKQGWS